ncbi:MAG TPA: TOBE domain-containing protein [bacterium]|nr:TOBE domain-containing protein [bacterium]
MPTDRETDILNPRQAAALLGLHAKTVVRMAREGRLPSTKALGRWRFIRGALQEWLAGRSVPPKPASGLPPGNTALSARNQLRGVVGRVEVDGLMAEVTVNLESGPLVAIITRASAERLGLQPNNPVTAVIKATEVLIGTQES